MGAYIGAKERFGSGDIVTLLSNRPRRITTESKIAKPRYDKRRFKVHSTNPASTWHLVSAPAFNTTFLPLELLLRKN